MNLRSSEMPWLSEAAPRPAFPALAADASCDVAVIGSGISGALAAYHLLKAGVKNVMVLDRRELCQGSIGASTALLQYELDTPLIDLIPRIGRPAAERCYRLCYETLSHFDALVAELGNACNYKRRQSLYLSGTELNPAEMYAEGEARRRIGIPVAYLDRPAVARGYGFDRAAALLSADAAEVDPCALTIQLIDAAVRMGLHAHGNTPVRHYDKSSDGVTLTTDAGHQITARRVVFATGYETQQFLGGEFVQLSSTFALVSEPVADFGAWKSRCLIWEANDPYFYARTTADGRIMIGGEDEPTTDPLVRDALMPAKAAALVRKFGLLFPQIEFKISRKWAGIFAETADGLPYIGRHRHFPAAYFSLGYGGNGITFALLAARLIRDDLLGVANPDAALFGFDRVPVGTRVAG